MTKKQLVRCIAFILVAFSMFLLLNDMFEMKDSANSSKRYHAFRSLEEDTVDVLFMGTSGIDRYWIAAQGYEDYGITSYPLSSDAFPAWLYTYSLDEALSYQNPSLIVLDIRPFTQSNYDRKLDTVDVRARRVLDTMPTFSVNRVKAAFKTMEIMYEVSEYKAAAKRAEGDMTAENNQPKFDISYLFSFVKYHPMWEEDGYLLEDHLNKEEHQFAGFYINEKHTLRVREQEFSYNADYTVELDEISKQALYDVIDYVRKNKLNVLFLDTPQCRTEKEVGRANSVYKILEEEKMPFIHYYSDKTENGFTIDLKQKEDFYNPGHVNYYGAVKFTTDFAAYLKENYDLEDRRKDEKVAAEWEGVHQALLDEIEELRLIKFGQQESQAGTLADEQLAADRLQAEVEKTEELTN